MSGEKTEKPTAKRRKEARKEGQVARTQELGGWATVLLFGLAHAGRCSGASSPRSGS